MAELVGVVSAAVSLASAAANTTKHILEMLDTVRHGSEKLQLLRKELNALQDILEAVDEAATKARHDIGASEIKNPASRALEDCQKELNELESTIRKFQAEGGDGSVKRIKKGIGIFLDEKNIDKKIQSLQRHEFRVSFALTANIYRHVVNSNSATAHASSPDPVIRKIKRTLTIEKTEVTTYSSSSNIPSTEDSEKHTYSAVETVEQKGVKGPNLAYFTTDRPSANFAAEQGNTTSGDNADSCDSPVYDPTHLLEVVRETIDRCVKGALETYQNNPGTKLEELLDLDSTQKTAFWKIELDSIQELHGLVNTRKREKFLQSLRTPDYYEDRLQVFDAQSKTCEWILEHPQYRLWQEKKESCILHIHGKPGSGKSVLAKSILESQIESYQPKGGENIKTQHQHQHPHSETLYYFCNNRKRGKDETGGSILRALIHQFAKSWPRLVDSVLEGHAATDSHGFLHDVAFEWSLKRLWEIFKTLVGESCLDKVFVVIDALDECERTSTEDLLFMLPDIMQSEEKTPEIKILLTSRTEDHIEEALLDQALSLPLRPELLEGDMVTVVRNGLHRLIKRRRLSETDALDLQNELVSRAEGMFLWASLAIKEVENQRRNVTIKTLKNLIKSLPSGLTAMYNKALQKIQDECQGEDDILFVQKVLTWVTMAARPLTLGELRIAMGVESSIDSSDSLELSLNITADVKTLGSFLEIVPSGGIEPSRMGDSMDDLVPEDLGATVRLIHQSAKDYLLDASGLLTPSLSRFRIEANTGHMVIACTCITYLRFKDFAMGTVEGSGTDATESLKEIFDARIETNGLLRYSLNWPHHLRRLEEWEGSHTMAKLACDFLTKFPKNAEAWYQIGRYISQNEFEISKGLTGLHMAAEWGLCEVVELLLDAGEDVDSVAEDGTVPLVSLIGSKHVNREDMEKICKLLIARKANVNAARVSDGATALLMAAQDGYEGVAKALIDAGADVNARSTRCSGWTTLHYASHGNHVSLAKLLLEKGANSGAISTDTEDGWAALHVAARYGNIEVAKELVENGAPIEQPSTSYGATPLMVSAGWNRLKTMEMLLDKGAEINAVRTKDGWSALHNAARFGHHDLVVRLLERGACPNLRTIMDAEGWAAIHIAAKYGFEKVIGAFVDRGASIDLGTIGLGLTPLLITAGWNQIRTAKFLLENGANINATRTSDQWSALHTAARFGHLKMAELLLSKGINSTVREKFGRHPIHIAAKFGHASIVKMFHGHGVAVDLLSEKTGITSLIYAAEAGHLDIVELLLKEGANVNTTQGDNKRSPLYYASQNGFLSVVKALLDAGAQPEDPSDQGSASIHRATVGGHLEIIKELIDRGVPVDLGLANDYKSAPLLIAAENGHLEIVNFLLEKGANINSQQAINKWNSLHFAAQNGHGETVKRLLEAGIEINPIGDGGWTALHSAAKTGHCNVIMTFLEHGLSVDRCWGEREITPLILAGEFGKTEAVKLLLEKGAKVNHIDRLYNRHALYYAAQNGHLDVTLALLDAGAEIDLASSNFGQTPLARAALGGHLEVVKLLCERGASPTWMDSLGRAVTTQAVLAGHVDVLNYLLERATAPWFLENALIVGISNREKEVVDAIMNLKPEPSSLARALSVAVWMGRDEVKMLIQRGAPTTASVLQLATTMMRHKILKGLLQTPGVDADACDDDGETALHWAATLPNSKHVVDVLVEAGADIQRTTKYGWSAAMIATTYYNTDVLRLPLSPPLQCPMIGPSWQPSYFTKEVQSDHVTVSNGGLTVSHDPSHIPTTVRSNRPICASSQTFYYEIRILETPAPQHVITVGYCAPGVVLMMIPGWRDCNNPTWAYHNDDGRLFCSKNAESEITANPTYSKGDVVGAGIDLRDGVIYFTKNGELLGERFTGVRGKVYPAVGMKYESRISANFGKDAQHPFVYHQHGAWEDEYGGVSEIFG